MEELHAAIAAFLRRQPYTSDAERIVHTRALWPERYPAPRCAVCGRPVDDDGGMFNLADMQLRRQCAEHYCPF